MADIAVAGIDPAIDRLPKTMVTRILGENVLKSIYWFSIVFD